jgi:hypothetical protein
MDFPNAFIVLGFSIDDSEWLPRRFAAGIRCVTGIRMIRDATQQRFVK